MTGPCIFFTYDIPFSEQITLDHKCRPFVLYNSFCSFKKGPCIFLNYDIPFSEQITLDHNADLLFYIIAFVLSKKGLVYF